MPCTHEPHSETGIAADESEPSSPHAKWSLAPSGDSPTTANRSDRFLVRRLMQRRPVAIALSLTVIVATTFATCFVAADHARDNRRDQDRAAMAKAVSDWVELLLTIPDDPRAGDAQMEEMKRRTANPLQSRFEDTIAPYFRDYALWGGPPFSVTSVGLFAGSPGLDAAAVDSTARFLVTISAGPARPGRGYGFWTDVTGTGGHYLITDFGAVK